VCRVAKLENLKKKGLRKIGQGFEVKKIMTRQDEEFFDSLYVLGSTAWGLGFGALLNGVFGILYVLISLEDYALLAGSLTLFGFLALAMVLTRQVDGYQLSEGLTSGHKRFNTASGSNNDSGETLNV